MVPLMWQSLAETERQFISVERLGQFVEAPQEEVDLDEEVVDREPAAVPSGSRRSFKRVEVSWRNVWKSYTGPGQYVLRSVSCVARPGCHTCFVGRSAAGVPPFRDHNTAQVWQWQVDNVGDDPSAGLSKHGSRFRWGYQRRKLLPVRPSRRHCVLLATGSVGPERICAAQ